MNTKRLLTRSPQARLKFATCSTQSDLQNLPGGDCTLCQHSLISKYHPVSLLSIPFPWKELSRQISKGRNVRLEGRVLPLGRPRLLRARVALPSVLQTIGRPKGPSARRSYGRVLTSACAVLIRISASVKKVEGGGLLGTNRLCHPPPSLTRNRPHLQHRHGSANVVWAFILPPF